MKFRNQANNANQHLKQAITLHQAGQLKPASALYEKILKKNPRHADALHMLGVAKSQLGEIQSGIQLIQKALDQQRHPQFYISLGNAHLQDQNVEAAIESYSKALNLDSQNLDALINLGNTYQTQDNLVKAVETYQSALKIDPTCSDAWNNLGNAYKKQSQFENALIAYSKAIEYNPNYPSAWCNRGSLHHDNESYDLAIADFEASLKLQPNNPDFKLMLGRSLKASGQTQSAIEIYQSALMINPNSTDLIFNLGNAYFSSGQLRQAEQCYRRILQLDYLHVKAWKKLGHVLQDQGNLTDAELAYKESLKLDFKDAGCWIALGKTLESQNKYQDAVTAYQQAFQVKPTPSTAMLAALALPMIYESNNDLIEHRIRYLNNLQVLLEEGMTLENPIYESPLSFFYLAYQQFNNREISMALAEFYTQAIETRTLSTSRKPNLKPRIGFISSYLRKSHTIGKLNRGLIQQLDGEQFDRVIFSVNPPHKDFDEFDPSIEIHSLAKRSLKEAADCIEEQNIDILIYTDIGMDATTYFLALSRLAPVQCVMWGHPATTGIPNMDFFITSRLIEPDNFQDHYSENILLMDTLPTYYHRPALPEAPVSKTEFGFEATDHLYLCPQSLFKLHPEFDTILAEILRRDPQGKIVLLKFMDGVDRALKSRLQKYHPDIAHRIILHPTLPHRQFIRLLTAADVVLDPIYFGGGNTTYETLAVGTPVVTWPGEFMRARVTVGCYQKMNFLDCVVDSAEAYIEKALEIAQNPQYREQLKAAILAKNHVLYEDTTAITELSEFLNQAYTQTLTQS